MLKAKAESFGKVYGSLYEAYDPEYYWFETLIMIQKALLTGGLVLVAPGSSTQILVGLVIALTFYTVLLKTQPYAGNAEDTMQSIATASTVMTLLIGFALKTTASQGEGGEGGERGMYDMVIMDVLLVGMFTLVAASGFYMVLVSLPCCACLAPRDPEEKKGNAIQKNGTVAPATVNTLAADSTRADSARLREIRLKHGAASAEYHAAVRKVQQH